MQQLNNGSPRAATPRLQIISKPPSILNSTRDFVQLFVHHAGEFETPRNFLEWGAISLIAACVAERCHLTFFRDRPLFPNLYTFLLADSGVGKGNTCSLVTSFLKDRRHTVRTGVEESRTTMQGLMDKLAGRFSKPGALLEYLYGDLSNAGPLALIELDEEAEERAATRQKVFLVFEELALSIGSGQRADDFIKFLTGAYDGKPPKDFTRTHGEVDLGERLCLNVLAGSTHRWLKDSVSLDAVLGGFFARCIVVDGDADFRRYRRMWRPRYPQDTDLVRAHLERRVEELLDIEGEFRLTDEAEAMGEKWYLERPDPSDPTLGPIFRRERATVLKLSLLFALAEGRMDFKIHSRHMARAQAAIRQLGPALSRVVAHSSITRDTRGLVELREFIDANQPVSHAACSRHMSSLGVGPDQFRNLLTIMRDTGELETRMGSQPGRKHYALRTEGRSLSEVIDEYIDEEPESDEAHLDFEGAL